MNSKKLITLFFDFFVTAHDIFRLSLASSFSSSVSSYNVSASSSLTVFIIYSSVNDIMTSLLSSIITHYSLSSDFIFWLPLPLATTMLLFWEFTVMFWEFLIKVIGLKRLFCWLNLLVFCHLSVTRDELLGYCL